MHYADCQPNSDELLWPTKHSSQASIDTHSQLTDKRHL